MYKIGGAEANTLQPRLGFLRQTFHQDVKAAPSGGHFWIDADVLD
jgi:hypothetical protein